MNTSTGFLNLISPEMKLRALRLLTLLAWMALIFLISAIPEPLEQTPSAFAQMLQNMRFLGIQMVAVISFIIHFTLYFVLGFLAVRAFTPGKAALSLKLLLTPFLVCILYALSDEFHQQFVPGRGFEWVDLLADVVGIISGLLAYSYKKEGNCES